MDGPHLARAFWNVATLRVGCCHLFGLFAQSAGLLALMRFADRHPITLPSFAARCCTRVLPTPVRPVMPSRRQMPSQTEGKSEVPWSVRRSGDNRAELILLVSASFKELFVCLKENFNWLRRCKMRKTKNKFSSLESFLNRITEFCICWGRL